MNSNICSTSNLSKDDMTKTFRELFSFDARKMEADRIRKKYPTRIPVIVERGSGRDVPMIDKRKFLVPDDLTMNQMAYVVRKRLKLKPEEAIFLNLESGIYPAGSDIVSRIYEEYKDDAGFLTVYYSKEATFGRE